MPAVRDLLSTINGFAHAGRRTWSGRRVESAARAASVATVGHDPPPARLSAYEGAGVEPPLEQVLADPIVQLLMRADRLEAADVRKSVGAVQRSGAS